MTSHNHNLLSEEEIRANAWLWELIPGGCGQYINGSGSRKCGESGSNGMMVARVYCMACEPSAESSKVINENRELRDRLAEVQKKLDAVMTQQTLMEPIIKAAIQWNEDGEPMYLETAIHEYLRSRGAR